MKLLSLISVLFLTSFSSTYGQGILVPEWTKFEESILSGNLKHAEAWGVDVDATGSIYWVVSVENLNQGLDILAHKYDATGNDLWTTPFTYGGPGNQHAFVSKVKGSSLYIGGKTCPLGQGTCDMLLLDVDNAASTLNWDRTNGFSANSYDELDGIAFLDDGIYCGGWAQEYESPLFNTEIGLWKLDYSGTTEWTNYLGELGTAEHQDGHFVVDENYIYAAGLWGGTSTANLFNGHSFLGKFSSTDGSFIDSALFGTQSSNIADFENALSMTSEGDYLYITGYTTLPSTNNVQLYVTKYDKNLNQLWYFDWGGSTTENARGIAVKDGIIHLAGWTESASLMTGGARDLIYMKMDTSGTILSYQTWGGSDKDAPHDIVIGDERVYITGTTAHATTGRKNAFLLAVANPTNSLNKLDSDFFTFNVFPNPTNEKLNLKFNHALNENAEMTIFDSTGKIVTKMTMNAGTTELNLNLKNPGFYSVLVETSETRILKKVSVF